MPDGVLRLAEPRGKWVLAATILGSSLAMLDATVVNVALPRIGDELDASLAGLQWTVNGYALTLAGLILLGGSLSDRFGRRRIFVIGVAWFAVASALCGLAPTLEVLVAARGLQGVGGALLTPGALAIIQASFVPGDRPKAVGAWSGLGGVAAAIGPFLGGWIIESVGWRWVFLINLPLAAIIIVIALRYMPESMNETARPGFDVAGAVLAATSLAALTYTLTEAPTGHTDPKILIAGAIVAVVAGWWFVVLQRRRSNGDGTPPMLPLEIFRSRQFSAINAVTFVVYGGMGVVFFLLVLQLQVVSDFSPLGAGMALLPVTVLLLLLSASAGALAQRIGPRGLMTAGLVVAAGGLLLMVRIGPNAQYFTDVLPAVTVFGLGLAAVVAPLTATVLASAEVRHAGVASGVNNAVARAAGLLAVAGVPPAVGLSGAAYTSPATFDNGFRTAVVVSAVLVASGAILTFTFIRNNVLAGEPNKPECSTHCAISSPPLEPQQKEPVKLAVHD